MTRLAVVALPLLWLAPALGSEPPSLLESGATPVVFEPLDDVVAEGSTFVAQGPDPSVSVRLDPPFVAGSDGVLEIILRAPADPPDLVIGQIFTKPASAPAFRESASRKFLVCRDGRWHRYLVPLTTAPASPNVGELRLDPFNGAGTFEIRSGAIGRSKPPAGDPAFNDFRKDRIDLDWLPGPGLLGLGDGKYRVRGPEAYLLSPGWLSVEAARATLGEVHGAVELAGGAEAGPARLSFGPEPEGREAGELIIPSLTAIGTTQYFNLMLVPGWTGTIRRLRLEPFANPAPVGSTARLDWIKTIPLQTDPATSFFVRHAGFFGRHNPTRVLLALLGGLAGLFFVATGVARTIALARGGSPSWELGLTRILARLSTATVLLTLVLLAVFPFEYYVPLRVQFFHGQIDVPQALLLFAFAIGLTRRLFYGPGGAAVVALERAAAGVALVLLAGSLLSPNRDTSFAYLERYYLTFLAALLAGVYCQMGPRLFKGAIATLLLSLGFVSFVGVVQAAGWKDFIYGSYFRAFQPLFYHANLRPKAFSTLGHQLPLASYLLALMPLALFAATRERSRLRTLGRAVALLSFGCLLLTMSRGAYVAFAVSSPFLWRLCGKHRRTVVAAAAAVLLLAAVVIITRRPTGAVAPFDAQGVRAEEVQSPFIWSASQGKSVFFTQRLLGARVSLSLARRHPFFGAGLGQFKGLYDKLLPAGVFKRNPIWSTAENAYLMILAEGGILGLGSLLILLGVLGRFFWRATRWGEGDDRSFAFALLASLVGFCVHMADYDGLHWFTAPSVFFAVVGLSTAALVAWSQPSRQETLLPEMRSTRVEPIELEWLNVEFSSKCNLACKWCSLDHRKPAVFMTEDLLSRSLDEVLDEGAWHVGEIALHNAGEVLLHPRLPAMLGVIAGKRRGREHFPMVSLLTNGTLLDEAKAKILLASGALDLVRFSVDGGTPEAFEELRSGAKWRETRANIVRFCKMSKSFERPVRTGIICLVPPDKALALDWMADEFRELLLTVDQYELRPPHNWDGSRELGLDQTGWKQYEAENVGKVCKFLRSDLVILPDGRVTVCCADLNARGVLGSLANKTLAEIHGSEERKGMIRAFVEKDKASIPLCKDCSGYY